MKHQRALFVCSIDHRRPQESLGTFAADTKKSTIYTEVLRLVNYYISERERVRLLCQGQGIATIRDPLILRQWRALCEVLEPLVFNKIQQLPRDEQAVWHTLLYREQIKLCFVLSPEGEVEKSNLPYLIPIIDDVRRRQGRTASLVARDPAINEVKEVLRLSRQKARFALREPSKGKLVRGLQIVGPNHPLVEHPLVQSHLLV